MTITQIQYSSVLKGSSYRPDHGGRIAKLLNLKPYNNRKYGALFYGCYNPIDHNIIKNHRGIGVVLWGGSDVSYMRNYRFKFPKNIHHIVFTKHNQTELKRYGVFAKVKPVVFLDPKNFPLYPLGRSVFCYTPHKRGSFYGIRTIKQVADKLPKINFILARYAPKKKPFPNCTVYPLLNIDGLIKLYKASFCSIRPTRHDGFPQSIVELGLMGRRTGWIYDSEHSVKCKTVNDYVNFIKNERIRTIPRKQLRQLFLKISQKSSHILDEY